MDRGQKLSFAMAIAAPVLAGVLAFLLSLTAGWANEWLRPYAASIYVLLALLFAASVGMSVWQARVGRRAKAASIQQRARGEGVIERSPNRIAGEAGGSIRQDVSDTAQIKNSGNTIE